MASGAENLLVKVEGMGESEGIIRVTVRSAKDRKDLEISEAATVLQLKEQIAAEFSVSLDQQCVIYAGKILKDTDRLKNTGVVDGVTVHLVVKSANRSFDPLENISSQQVENWISAGITPQQIDVRATPFGLGEMGGLAGLSNLGMGSANFMDLQQSLQRELFKSPDLMRCIIDNPLVQQITQSPGLLLQLINANPQMRELIQKNPEISQMLSNSELMIQTLDVARNPALLQEMLRAGERVVSSTTASTAGRVGCTASSQDTDTEKGGESGRDSQDKSSSSTTGTGDASRGASESLFSDPGITSLMQQMAQNPQLMTNILQSTYMQSMIQFMTSNPQLLEQMMSLNRTFSDNAPLMEQMRRNIPLISQQLGDPELQSLMTNPRALQAMMQVHEGLQQLHGVAPQLVSRLGVTPLEAPPTGTTDPARPLDPYAQFISHVLSTTAPVDTSTSSEDRYARQLIQLDLMGFKDKESCLQALIATSGNVNTAIDQLLQKSKVLP